MGNQQEDGIVPHVRQQRLLSWVPRASMGPRQGWAQSGLSVSRCALCTTTHPNGVERGAKGEPVPLQGQAQVGDAAPRQRPAGGLIHEPACTGGPTS